MTRDELAKAFEELPKVKTNNSISAMNAINVDDLMNAVDRLNKIPDYNDLLKENKELKKQVEKERKEISEYSYKLCHFRCEETYENQQKEFIKWLEKKQSFLRDEISELTLGMCNTDFQDIKIEVYQEVLQKYKEIIGVSDENNQQ